MSTFHTSRTERGRRRTDGPELTLIVGTAGTPGTTTRDPRPVHPAQEGFTPDGIASDVRGAAVQDSEPGSSPSGSTSRGRPTLDTEGRTAPGSGPIDHRGLLLGLVAEFLEAHAGDAAATTGDAEVHHIR